MSKNLNNAKKVKKLQKIEKIVNIFEKCCITIDVKQNK